MKKTDKRTVKIILINPLINNNKYIDIYPNKIMHMDQMIHV